MPIADCIAKRERRWSIRMDGGHMRGTAPTYREGGLMIESPWSQKMPLVGRISSSDEQLVRY